MENATKVKLGLFVGFILVLVVVVLASSPKQCGTDQACFDARAAKCQRAVVQVTNLENQFVYDVRGKKGAENCIVKIQLVQVNPNAVENLKKALQGKGMLCEVPKAVLAEKTLAKIDDINDYCTGPLKEMLLEISLENLYEVVVKQIGPLAVQFRQSLEALNTTA